MKHRIAPTPEPVTVQLTVRAAFRHFPGCCPDPIEVGEPMCRMSNNRYVPRPAVVHGNGADVKALRAGFDA